MSISYTQKLKTTFGELTYSEEKLAQYIDEHRSEMTDITSQQLAAEVRITVDCPIPTSAASC